MKRRRPVRAHRPGVLGGDVADVLLEPELRVVRGDALHEPVTRDLGDDRGGRDRGAAPVAADHGAMRACAARDAEAVGHAHVRLGVERAESPTERVQVRPVQAAAVDLGRRHDEDRDLCGPRDHRLEQLLAAGLGMALGVVEQAERGAAAPRSWSMSRHTAAATSGPASEPRPASSAPATNRAPRSRSWARRRRPGLERDRRVRRGDGHGHAVHPTAARGRAAMAKRRRGVPAVCRYQRDFSRTRAALPTLPRR